MDMPYTKNPYMPKVRRDAAEDVRRGTGVRTAARKYEVLPRTISKWVKKAKSQGYGLIPTESSRPKTSPRALQKNVVEAIIEKRSGRKRCGQVVYQELLRGGVVVSLSSVQRTLERCGLLKKRSAWKRPHDATPRPEAAYAGASDSLRAQLSDF